ncbi:hypothetical protein MLD38_003314 [Melastoma candidum]|uniref:Uncharacterized protein n=1 Tax=Melastoma candidum TaxID=119954 RepID=A0ACB9SAQ8_9MYRT|nr:hypothetical protein MLD38_003314 [Melastoma candidum]
MNMGEEEHTGAIVEDIAVVGGGICGLATALALHRKGIRSVVLERSGSLRATGGSISIKANGWIALDYLGLGTFLRDKSWPIKGFAIVDLDKGMLSNQHGRFDLVVAATGLHDTKSLRVFLFLMKSLCRERDDGNRSIRRGDLVEALAGELPSGTIRYGHHVRRVLPDCQNGGTILELSNGTSMKVKVLIGCDGTNSVVAKYLEMKPPTDGLTCVMRGLSCYPKGHGYADAFTLFRKGRLSIGRVPVDDKVVYWELMQKWTSEFSKISHNQELIKIASLAAMESFPDEMSDMINKFCPGSLNCTGFGYHAPWDILLGRFRREATTVAGDALHSSGPFLGQGGGIGLEDAIVMARCISEKISEENTSPSAMPLRKYKEALCRYSSKPKYLQSLPHWDTVPSDRRGLLHRGRLLFGRPIVWQVLLGLTVSSMRAYADYEYGDYDDYADEDEEQLEDAEEEEEDPRPTKEALEYLELRQKFKEALRKKMKKEGQSPSQDKRKPSYDNFGSFFGPSKPVIAPRVIQESKSLLENPHLASRVLQSHQNTKKISSTSNGSRSGFHEQASRVVNQMRTKAQILKDKRDYSFLFSDDAELPAPSKQPPPRNVSVPTFDARVAKPSLPSNHVTGSSSRQPAHNGDRRPFPSNSHLVSKLGLNKLPPTSRTNTTSPPSKRQLGGNNSIGPGRPRPPSNCSQSGTPSGSQSWTYNGLPPNTSNGSLPRTSNGLHVRTSNGLQSSTSNRLLSKNSASLHSKMSSGVQSKTPAGVPSKIPNKSGYSQATKLPPSTVPRAASGKASSSSVMKHQLDHRREVREPSRKMVPPKQPMAAPKPQIARPLNQAPSRVSSQEQRIKKRPGRQFSDDNDDSDRAISMIRKMFGYNPQRFAGREEDDSDMEANFDEIMKEEKRSARIARKEDEEQLRLIEEEERREHMRKMAKKQKTIH